MADPRAPTLMDVSAKADWTDDNNWFDLLTAVEAAGRFKRGHGVRLKKSELLKDLLWRIDPKVRPFDPNKRLGGFSAWQTAFDQACEVFFESTWIQPPHNGAKYVNAESVGPSFGAPPPPSVQSDSSPTPVVPSAEGSTVPHAVPCLALRKLQQELVRDKENLERYARAFNVSWSCRTTTLSSKRMIRHGRSLTRIAKRTAKKVAIACPLILQRFGGSNGDGGDAAELMEIEPSSYQLVGSLLLSGPLNHNRAQVSSTHDLHRRGFQVEVKAMQFPEATKTQIRATPNENIFNTRSRGKLVADGGRQQTIGTPSWTADVLPAMTAALRSRGVLRCSNGEKTLARLVGLRSCSRRSKHKKQQPRHADSAPRNSLRDSRPEDVPLACIVALQDGTRLYVWPFDTGEMEEIVLNEGDMILFRGDLGHAGAEYDEENWRLHVYIDSPVIRRATDEDGSTLTFPF